MQSGWETVGKLIIWQDAGKNIKAYPRSGMIWTTNFTNFWSSCHSISSHVSSPKSLYHQSCKAQSWLLEWWLIEHLPRSPSILRPFASPNSPVYNSQSADSFFFRSSFGQDFCMTGFICFFLNGVWPSSLFWGGFGIRQSPPQNGRGLNLKYTPVKRTWRSLENRPWMKM